jgi:hypothetical protein
MSFYAKFFVYEIVPQLTYNVLRTGLVPLFEYLNVQMSAETHKAKIRGIRLVRCWVQCIRPAVIGQKGSVVY